MWVAALLTASCTPALKVEVANTTPTERDDETVEIAWSEVAALKGVTPDNIVVLNDDNEQIPSQVLFRGGTEPQALIFQTDADPMETKRFKIVTLPYCFVNRSSNNSIHFSFLSHLYNK